MRNSIFVFISVFFLLSCSKRESSRILISGKVKNIPAKKLYLTDAYDWQVFLDSTSYVHNEFKFNYKPPGTFEPFLASICYFDSSNRIRKLFFKNFILSTTEKIYGFDAFFLEKGMTTIIGDINIKPDLDIVTGKETELLYKNQFTSWGYVNENDSLKRSEKIKQIKKTITENNESFYLLNCILEHRLSYRKEEFGTIFKLFSDSVQKSQTGTFLNKYLNILLIFRAMVCTF